MIQTLRNIFKCMDRSQANGSSGTANGGGEGDGERTAVEMPSGVTDCSVKRIVLLYGVVRNA